MHFFNINTNSVTKIVKYKQIFFYFSRLQNFISTFSTKINFTFILYVTVHSYLIYSNNSQAHLKFCLAIESLRTLESRSYAPKQQVFWCCLYSNFYTSFQKRNSYFSCEKNKILLYFPLYE